jgi:shikimate dehydrogenase
MRDFKNQTGTDFKKNHVCILGAGGTAKTLAVKIALEGAAKVDIINRSLANAIELAAAVNKVMEKAGRSETIAFAFPSGTVEARQKLSCCDIIINTTSVGMYPNIDNCPVQQDFIFNSRQIVYDVIYNPAQTKLLTRAKANGCKTFNGSGMLFYQGLKAFEIWLDTVVPKEIFTNLSSEFLKYLEV